MVLKRSAAVVLCLLLSITINEQGVFWRLRGGVSRLCFDLLELEYDNSGGIFVTKPFYTTYWVVACSRAFGELGPDQRRHLNALLDRPLPPRALRSHLLLSRQGAAPKPLADSTKSDLRKAVLQSKPRESATVGPDAENLTRMVLEHAGGMPLGWLDLHRHFADFGRPVQEPVVEPSEVGKALQEGRLVRFDATKILPPKIFNVTLDLLSKLHAPDGDDIPIVAFMHESKKCRHVAHYLRKYFPFGALFCKSPPALGATRRGFPDSRRMPEASRIALRRLPRYIDEDTMIKDLGLQGVERPEGQIIMGYATGDTHWDEQDNIFIQASGVSVVFGVPPEYTDAIVNDRESTPKSSSLLWNEFLHKDEVRQAVPWYYMVLKPGDAIAIPSRAFHAVYGGHNRLSLQTFLEPRYRGMVWQTNKHSYWHKESETRQALRNLYFKTVGRLWDTWGIGMILQGGCIEYL